MKHLKLTTQLITATGALCFSLAALGDHHLDDNPASIKLIDSEQFGISKAEIADIRQKMQTAVDGDFIPGALLLVGNSEGVGLMESVGYQAKGASVAIDEETIFRIYSMTKPIISVAIMTMVEDDLIKLDDPVSKYIPEFADLKVIDRESSAVTPAKTVMTIEHLLTQESGLIQAIFSPDSALGKMYQSELTGDLTARELAGRLGKLPVYFEPGSAWHYGHSTDVLGAILEVAAGKTLDLVLAERIFEPLGMDETSFWVPVANANRIAEPIYGEGMQDNTIPRAMLSGGGGLNSTTEDYVRFAQMLLEGGEYRGHRIIEEATLDMMTQKYIGEEVSREFYFFGERGDWGLGFHLQPSTEDSSGPHNFGWRGIGGTLFAVDRENDFFMIYMEQKRGGPAAPFNNNVAQRVVYDAIMN
ncbi:MAG: CubicO group peptidase (beta-lactamase class C family) [Pseudohongiellaceae bacterium]|jgi:CubicO group peptidase (beta-lactamase class C family)